MNNNFRAVTDEKRWKQEAANLLDTESFPEDFISDFHSAWTQAAHHIRSQIGDDIQLSKLLWHVLPRYTGPDVKLYRGENIDRFKEGSIGFCWTPSVETASMFGRGLNATGIGGVLLSCKCKSEWIISAPNEHSVRLGEKEHTVDPGKISGIKILSEYAPID